MNTQVQSTALTILDKTVRMFDGLYSLNDLHKASGSEDKNSPKLFVRNQQTQDLINEICQGTDLHLAIKTVHGGTLRGTYVCRELVYAYAMWISAKFHLLVIRAFDAMYTRPVPQEQLVLSNGQHYVVAKDGVVIYHKVLSDRTAKNYLQPTIEHQASIVIDIPRENVKHNNTLMPNLHTLNTLYDGYGINGNPLVRLFATLIQAQKDGKPITVKDVSGARLVYEMTEALARQYNQALDNIKRAADNAYSSGMFLPIK